MYLNPLTLKTFEAKTFVDGLQRPEITSLTPWRSINLHQRSGLKSLGLERFWRQGAWIHNCSRLWRFDILYFVLKSLGFEHLQCQDLESRVVSQKLFTILVEKTNGIRILFRKAIFFVYLNYFQPKTLLMTFELRKCSWFQSS